MYNSKLLKGIMILMILVDSLVFLLYYFGFEDIKNRNYNIAGLKSDLSEMTEKQQYVSSLEKVIENMNINLTRIDSSIVQKGKDVEFIEGLENLAKNNNLSVNIDSLAVEESPALATAELSLLRIKIKISGAWSDVYSFLHEIEHSQFKTKIYRLAIINSEDLSEDSGKPQVSNPWQAEFEIGVLKHK